MTSAPSPAPPSSDTLAARLRRTIVARPVAVLVATFFVGYWALLSNPGIYWDDWTSFDKPLARVIAVFTDYGTPLHGYVTYAAIGHPLLAHVASGLAHLFSCLAWRHVLVHSKVAAWLSPGEIFTACVVFVAAPFNFGRVALINTTYNLSLLVFSLAAVVLVTYVRRGGAWRRALALALFALSFTTSSLLFFYAAPMLLLFVERAGDARPSLARAARFVRSHLDFLLLPPVYFVLHGKAFPLRAAAANAAYNAITGENLLAVPLSFARFVKNSPLAVARTMISEVVHAPVWALIGFLVALALLVPSIGDDERAVPSWKKIVITLAVGAGLTIFGVLPYLLVGKPPANVPFFVSRHELLVPFGFAATVLAGTMALTRLARARRGLIAGGWVALVVTASLIVNNVRHVAALREWVYVESLRAAIAADPTMREKTAFLFDDHRMPLESKRMLKVKELCGYMRAAFGDERRFALALRERENWDEVLAGGLGEHFNFGEFVPRPPEILVHVDVHRDLPAGHAMRAALAEVLGHREDLARVTAPLLTLRLEPIEKSVRTGE